jgi:nicotinamidase-related amidase
MDANRTALILIGYQNDYFASDGILHGVIEESAGVTNMLANTVELIKRLRDTFVLMISTPILFTSDYSELIEPVGILKAIREVGAFRAGTRGGETISELQRFGSRILEVPGKRGLNAFSNTDLDRILKEHDIADVVLAGVVTSICIDSTGRSAFDRGYRATILSDCTSGRTTAEQEFYCQEIFQLYAEVLKHAQLLECLGLKG